MAKHLLKGKGRFSLFSPRYGEKKTRWLFGRYIAMTAGCTALSLVIHFTLDPDLAFIANAILLLCNIICGAYAMLRLNQRALLSLIEKASKNPEIEKLAGRGGC